MKEAVVGGPSLREVTGRLRLADHVPQRAYDPGDRGRHRGEKEGCDSSKEVLTNLTSQVAYQLSCSTSPGLLTADFMAHSSLSNHLNEPPPALEMPKRVSSLTSSDPD